ncbi:hypothetical protein QBC46DRAFT_219215, partial [Diplogelasinospora grovesii]
GDSWGEGSGEGGFVTISSSSKCNGPSLGVAIDLLGLNIDVNLYLSLAGRLLNSVGELVGVGSILGGATSTSNPTTVTQQFRAKCGKSFRNLPGGGKTTTAASAVECLRQCEADAIIATVQLGSLHGCLGATIDNSVAVDDCL